MKAKPHVLVIPASLEMEKHICARLAARLSHGPLPVMVITDETIMHKDGTVELFPKKTQGGLTYKNSLVVWDHGKKTKPSKRYERD